MSPVTSVVCFFAVSKSGVDMSLVDQEQVHDCDYMVKSNHSDIWMRNWLYSVLLSVQLLYPVVSIWFKHFSFEISHEKGLGRANMLHLQPLPRPVLIYVFVIVSSNVITCIKYWDLHWGCKLYTAQPFLEQ